jgi:alpha-L-fucosidase
MFREKIPVAEYEKLYARFNPSSFDADLITDLAVEAGMKYVNITACHHEGFCLWKSKTESFNSWNSVRRDLVEELSAACAAKGLGFFAYYTHVLNWRHPYMLPVELLGSARPSYPAGDPRYKLQRPDEYARYWEYAHACIAELAELPFPLAGIWLDIVAAYYQLPDLIPIEKTYALIRQKRPEALISYKQGATGTEDFASPEFHFASQGDAFRRQGNEAAAKLADAAWEKNRQKHNEICMTLQEGGWGYVKGAGHKDANTIWRNLAYARAHNCNLLANVGPLPDGSIHPDDVTCLKEVGRRIRERGLPGPEEALLPVNKTAAAGA